VERKIETTQIERDVPLISDPYWEDGCVLLDMVDDINESEKKS
jgi:hypothetical protein